MSLTFIPDHPAPLTPRQVSDRIIADVAAKHGLTADEMTRAVRSHKRGPARQEAMYELSRLTTLSTPQIASRLGLADHTSVVKGRRRHAERIGAA